MINGVADENGCEVLDPAARRGTQEFARHILRPAEARSDANICDGANQDNGEKPMQRGVPDAKQRDVLIGMVYKGELWRRARRAGFPA